MQWWERMSRWGEAHRFPIDEFQKGFEAMNSGHSGKVILDW